MKVNCEDKCKHRTQRIILVRLYKAYIQSPCKILQEPSLVPKLGTPDYFWSGDSLSNPIFHSSEDSHPVVLIRCWGTNPVLAAQGTNASFWSGVALTKLGTSDYFWSRASLSNPIFHSPEDSHPVVLIRCWGTNLVLAAQGTDASFWSSVALTNSVLAAQGTDASFWSGVTLTNPVLAAQGTDTSFWSGVALTNLVS